MPPKPDRELLPSELARLEEIRRVGTERSEELAVTFAAGFADDPFFQYMGRGAGEGFGEATWGYALSNLSRGVELLATQTSSAGAVWYPPIGSVPADTERPRTSYLDLLTTFVGRERAIELVTFLKSMGEQRPAEPHWYLSAIAVHPSAQNNGWGAKLLAPILSRCDQMGLHAYLESSNPRNQPFYLRHGFEITGTLGPDDGPDLTLMLRQPRT